MAGDCWTLTVLAGIIGIVLWTGGLFARRFEERVTQDSPPYVYQSDSYRAYLSDFSSVEELFDPTVLGDSSESPVRCDSEGCIIPPGFGD